MAPHANEITPSVTNAAHNETIPDTNNYLKKGINGDHANPTPTPTAAAPPQEEFSYPPYIPQDATYRVLKQYHSKPTKLRVACIGAGASGLCLAYKMGKQLVPGSWELTLFEKNPHFGGTWYENTYPGVACDVSSLPPFCLRLA